MKNLLVKSLLISLLIVLPANKALSFDLTFDMPYTPEQFISVEVIDRISPEIKKWFAALAAIFALHLLIKR
ncbi:MAG: hypothetical protein F6K22_18355 [Okeania sp. SIO2F4]|uniref:hypothetical protein n=1 Tax=Okeania sp. SIO2F4 TaxID=2607790 RepID=UPI001428F723|nr:hypothetical protein [Okeania sp. SIO2F4]NES04618.1 hypothetical protein [Okeania sp. SIO2F4]